MSIQNFSVPRGNSKDVNVDVVSGVIGDTLEGCTINWRVYEQANGVPTDTAVIEMTTGHGVTILVSPPMRFVIQLNREDTVDLDPGNYYHEAQIVDLDGEYITIVQGIMTITEAIQ